MPSPSAIPTIHERWMARCLELAKRGTGSVSPNPLVGSVIVDAEGNCLGEGWHQSYGGAHAEQNAIQAALETHDAGALHHSTLYVNLEPCSHFGKTPPCAKSIVERGIPRVVIGMIDPNKKVSGRGIKMLREAGVEVCMGVLQSACEELNAAFSHHIVTGRPLVILKIAQTLDGRIATASGDSKWVSGEAARKLVHKWRAQLDAILVGSGTALADDPALTVRHVEGRNPCRIVLDRTGSLSPSLKLFSDANANQTIAVVGVGIKPQYAQQLRSAGSEVIQVEEVNGHLDLGQLLDILGKSTENRRAIQSIMVEAGPGLATALFQHNLVDQLKLFVAPKLLGGGLPALDGLSIAQMKSAITFKHTNWQQVGEDMLFEGYRHP